MDFKNSPRALVVTSKRRSKKSVWQVEQYLQKKVTLWNESIAYVRQGFFPQPQFQ